MNKVWLGLGSNIGDREWHIENAIFLLHQLLQSVQMASIYQSRALEYQNQRDFLNTVIRGYTDLKPEKLFLEIKRIEQQCGRKKQIIPKGPRIIDIDILLYEKEVLEIKTPLGSLNIPHSAMDNRLFVLKPLIEIDPGLYDPRDGILWIDKINSLKSQDVNKYQYE